MRIEKMANIVLTEEEVKNAVLAWLAGNDHEQFVIHMLENHWTIDVNKDGEFVVCVDGIIETEEM